MIGPLRVARGDVAGQALIEAIAREQPKRHGKPLLPMTPLFGKVRARRCFIEPELAQRRMALQRGRLGGLSRGNGEIGHRASAQAAARSVRATRSRVEGISVRP